jgi:hypothetical protein
MSPLGRLLRRSLSVVLAAGVLAGALAPSAEAAPDGNVMMLYMKKLDEFSKAGNTKGLGGGLYVVSMMQPKEKEFAGWAAIAKKGYRAAAAGNLAGARASCTACHDKYKDAFRARHPGHVPKPVDQ